MIYKTFGPGGDYADLGLAILSLGNPYAILADDYTFTQVGDFTEATGYFNTSPTWNNHTVLFQNPDGYVITMYGKYFEVRPNGLATISDTIIYDGLIFHCFEHPDTGVPVPWVFAAAPWQNYRQMTVWYKNMVFVGAGTAYAKHTAVINRQSWGCRDYIVNCKITNFTEGINLNINEIFVYTGTDHYVENTSIYNCGTGVVLPLNQEAADRNCMLKNVVAAGCVTSDFAAGGSHNIIANCADSDNTISSSGAILTSNHSNIIPADEFESLVSANDDFLKLQKIDAIFVVSGNPRKGIAPLPVKFEHSVRFDGGSKVLYKGGVVPSLSSVDLAGEAYGEFGHYPIGCYNAQTNTLGDFWEE